MIRTKTTSLVICMLGLFAVTQARAETINFTISGQNSSGVPFNIAAPSLPGGNPTFVVTDTTALNAALTGAGSAYQFSTLVGTSTSPGTALRTELSASGVVTLGVVGSSSPLTILETESGFTLPSSGPVSLASNATANFIALPGTQTSVSSLNAIVTPQVTLNGLGALSDNTSIPIASFTTPFTLDNESTMSLTVGGVNLLSLGTVVTAAPNEIPLPAAFPLFASGLGALGLFGWRRKRNAAAAS